MRIEVAGIPAPQGSKRHVGGGRMVEVSRAVGPWREAVRAETQRAALEGVYTVDDLPVFVDPVAVEIHFWLARPKSAPKSVTLPAKRPDLDKLARAVLDGLVAGGAIADDSQVCTLYLRKRFGAPGCVIYLEEHTDGISDGLEGLAR